MEWLTEERPGMTIIRIQGRIDPAYVSVIDHGIRDLIAGGNRRIVMDLQDLVYINSGGLRVFIMTAKTLNQPGDLFGIAGIRGEVRQVFEIAGLMKIFTVYQDIESAVTGAGNDDR